MAIPDSDPAPAPRPVNMFNAHDGASLIQAMRRHPDRALRMQRVLVEFHLADGLWPTVLEETRAAHDDYLSLLYSTYRYGYQAVLARTYSHECHEWLIKILAQVDTRMIIRPDALLREALAMLRQDRTPIVDIDGTTYTPRDLALCFDPEQDDPTLRASRWSHNVRIVASRWTWRTLDRLRPAAMRAYHRTNGHCGAIAAIIHLIDGNLLNGTGYSPLVLTPVLSA